MRYPALSVYFTLTVVGLVAGCGGHKKKDHAARSAGVVITSATASPQKVFNGDPFQLAVAATTSSTPVYKWTQAAGPTATFNNGSEAPSIAMTAPVSTTEPAGWMEFRVEVRSGPTGPPASETVFVLFDGVHQHLLDFAYNSAAGAPDSVTAKLTRNDGSPVDPTRVLQLEYTIVLTNGETHVRNGILLATGFETQSSFGNNNAGQPISLAAGNISTITVIVRENGIDVRTLAIPGGSVSFSYS